MNVDCKPYALVHQPSLFTRHGSFVTYDEEGQFDNGYGLTRDAREALAFKSRLEAWIFLYTKMWNWLRPWRNVWRPGEFKAMKVI